MKIKLLASAVILFASMSSAFANTIVLSQNSPGHYTGTFGAIHTAGTFSDVYSITPVISGMVDTLITSVGFTSAANIDFTSAFLNNVALTRVNDVFELAYTQTPISLTGPLTLTLNGVSGSSASYGGSLNVLAAVPEPETYALMLGGLGFVGFMARRRKAAALAA